jgi:hypothetical protein
LPRYAEELFIAKNRISFAKRAREVEKKRKQEEKRAKRKDPSLRLSSNASDQDQPSEDTTSDGDRSDNTNP